MPRCARVYDLVQRGFGHLEPNSSSIFDPNAVSVGASSLPSPIADVRRLVGSASLRGPSFLMLKNVMYVRIERVCRNFRREYFFESTRLPSLRVAAQINRRGNSLTLDMATNLTCSIWTTILNLMQYRCTGSMVRTSHRDKILSVGMQVVHERGFGDAGIRDIVQAAGVPQGSFTYHFESKEAFALEIIDLYFASTCAMIQDTLRNDSSPSLQRLQAYIDAGMSKLNENGMRDGCLFGNFAGEASNHSEGIRLRVNEIFVEVRESVAYCLRAAVAAGELAQNIDCDDLAAFIVSSQQGANLLAKTEHSPEQSSASSRSSFPPFCAVQKP
jgi:TetR/AcrR family transcriptional repressor of nem operon